MRRNYPQWLPDLAGRAGKVPKMLVGTKKDLVASRQSSILHHPKSILQSINPSIWQEVFYPMSSILRPAGSLPSYIILHHPSSSIHQSSIWVAFFQPTSYILHPSIIYSSIWQTVVHPTLSILHYPSTINTPIHLSSIRQAAFDPPSFINPSFIHP